MLSSNSDTPPELDLLEIGRIIWQRKISILLIASMTGLVAYGLSLALPKSFAADATILPLSSNDSSGAIAAGLAAQLGPAAGMLAGLNGLASSRTADLVEVLSSRSMIERVIARTHLERELTGWKSRQDLVRGVAKQTTVTAPTMKKKVVIIQVRMPRPELAAAVANAYVSELKDMLDEIGYNSASKNRKFIEDQLSNVKTSLLAAEDQLTRFQATNRLASLPETVVASIKSISELEAQRIGAEVQLKTTDEALSMVKSRVSSLQADPATMLELEVKRKGLKAQSEALASAQQSFLDKLTSLPPKGMALARLQRDVQVQNAIYLALTQQLETAVINENKDSDAFLVLDRAEVPDKPSKPRKLVITLLGLLAGLVLGIVRAYVLKQHAQDAAAQGHG